MSDYRLGDLRLTILTDGNIELPPNYGFYEAADASSEEAELVARMNVEPAIFGQNPLIVDSPVSGRTLIDAGVGTHTLLNSRRFGPEAGQLAARLSEVGVGPESVDRILITHLHPDHCWGLINPDGSAAFPNASLYLHADELNHWTDLEGVDTNTPPVDANRCIGALFAVRPYKDRMVTFMDVTEIVDDITAIPRTGHTPGHTTYRLSSQGETLLSWGDTFHHIVQVEHPTVTARTDTGAGSTAQRQALLDQLADEQTTIHAYHLPYPGLGTVSRVDSGFRWNPLTGSTPTDEGGVA